MTNTFHKASQEKQLLQDTSCQKLTKIDNEPKKATPLLRSLAQMVKNLSVIWETWVRSLRWKDPVEEGMATHSSILAWRVPMDRETLWATVHGVAKSRT